MNRLLFGLLIVLLLTLPAGCDSESERVAEMAQDAAQRQAEQNREMVRLNREVADNNKRLIESENQSRQEAIQLQRELVERDTEGRQELNALQRDVQTAVNEERSSLDRQHEDLEDERREIAKQRHRDPIVAAAITNVGLILACLAPLGLAGYMLYCLRHSDSDPVLNEVLIEEIVSEQPMFLPSRPDPPSIASDQQALYLPSHGDGFDPSDDEGESSV